MLLLLLFSSLVAFESHRGATDPSHGAQAAGSSASLASCLVIAAEKSTVTTCHITAGAGSRATVSAKPVQSETNLFRLEC